MLDTQSIGTRISEEKHTAAMLICILTKNAFGIMVPPIMQKSKFPKLLQSLDLHKIQFLMLYLWYLYNINFSSTTEVHFVSVTVHENNFCCQTYF